jgi:acetyl esterase
MAGVHPQVAMLLERVARSPLPPYATVPPFVARRIYRDTRAAVSPPAPEVAEAKLLLAPGPGGPIPLRAYRPSASRAEEVLPALVYFHGGGWTIGDLDTHDVVCRQLANGARCAVFSVDYRMGPESPFPAAVDDCLAATQWVAAEADALRVDAERIAVGGDSAGGNLAAVVAQLARDAGDLPLRFQLLIYPATDQRAGAPSHATNGQGYMLTNESIAYYQGHYFAAPAHKLDPRASPLLREDLSGLPPALVLTAGFDPLRDEGLQYAERLTAAGNAASYVCFERQIHGFITMGKVIDEANAALALCAAELRRAMTA